jgi:AraC-like DNA-binding protein
MMSLQAGDINYDLNNKIPDSNGFLNESSQKAITILRHQIAVQKASNMIKERIQDLPTLAELAKSTGLSRTYLSFVFKEVTGMRLQDYLTQVRLEKAKDLLGNIDLKIKQIAHEAGFSDPNYFCRAFKRKTGLNPTNWRLINIFKWPGS